MNANSHQSIATRIARCIAISLLAFTQTILGGCQSTSSSTKPAYDSLFTEQAELFYQSLATLDDLADPNDTLWLININIEASRSRAWVGEVRDEVLHIYDVEFNFRSRTLRVLSEGQYDNFTPPRKESLVQIFTTPTHFVSMRDYRGSMVDMSFSGHGRDYVETVKPDSDLEKKHVSQWISDSNASLELDQPNNFVPIELAMPWLISRYYSANR